MATTAEKATAKRQQGEELAGGAAVLRPSEATVISYVEPDESAWKSAAMARREVQPVSTRPRKAVSVTLEKPFTDLPPGADRTVMLSNDPDEMLDHVMFVMAMGGWPAVHETFTKLQEAENGLGPVADTCLVQAQVMVNRLSVQLSHIEKIARQLTVQYLELGMQQAESATQAFLTGWPDLTATALQEHSYIRKKVRLNPGMHVTELRQLLKELPTSTSRSARQPGSTTRWRITGST